MAKKYKWFEWINRLEELKTERAKFELIDSIGCLCGRGESCENCNSRKYKERYTYTWEGWLNYLKNLKDMEENKRELHSGIYIVFDLNDKEMVLSLIKERLPFNESIDYVERDNKIFIEAKLIPVKNISTFFNNHNIMLEVFVIGEHT